MTVLIIGTVLFFGIHMLPAFQLNKTFVERLGEGPYKGVFSLVSFSGLGLIIWGFQLAPFTPLWTPIAGAREVTMALMPIAVILVCAADAPNNIKRVVRHPMLVGITLWGGLHLAANGDVASTIIFASFALFSLVDIILVEMSGRYKPKEPVSHKWDVGVVLIGLALYSAMFYFHGSFTGMPLV